MIFPGTKNKNTIIISCAQADLLKPQIKKKAVQVCS